ncbi:MAG: glycosyltransferase family 2 protein [Gammaproteobacteria bacterium]|nr:glycosyltransferase family 2 protein [Gammaproteobacteria bacterium]
MERLVENDTIAGNKGIKVSIVTPVFNSALYIADTIESVQAQTHSNWEMLITDDCSTDESVEVINAYAISDPRVRLFRLENNSGPGKARNLSILASQGDVIAFLDSDDMWDTKFLEKSLFFMEKRQAGIVFSSYRRLSEDLSEDLGKFIVPESTNYHDMLKSCPISCLTGMYHVERCRGKALMPDIRKRQDYCMWLDILKRGVRADGIREVMATYRIRSASVSRNKLSTAQYQWRVYRDIERLSFLESSFYLSQYMVRGLIKYYGLLTEKQ